MSQTNAELVEAAVKSLESGKHLTLYVDERQISVTAILNIKADSIQFRQVDGQPIDVSMDSIIAMRTVSVKGEAPE